MTFKEQFSHQWKTRLGQRAALASMALFFLILIYAGINGNNERKRLTASIETHKAVVSERSISWFDDLKMLEKHGSESEVSQYAGSPMDLDFASSITLGPLADFAIGQSDLLPSSGPVSLWTPDIRLFSKYEFDDPVSLILGGFDLSKAVIFLLPLLLIFLSFDVLSADRDSGRAKTILSQTGNYRKLFWQRLIIRSLAVITLLLVVSLGAFLLLCGTSAILERAPYYIMWAVSAITYACFWISLIALVATRNLSSQMNAMILLLLWAGLTLIIPASVSTFTESVYPTPSRLTYLAEAREQEIETELNSEKSKLMIVDHPEMITDSGGDIPDYIRTAYLVTAAVDKSTGSILTGFENAANNREQSTRFLRYLSPAIIVNGSFNEIAGTSSERYRSYVNHARQFKAAYLELVGPIIMSGQRLPSSMQHTLPEFKMPDLRLVDVMKGNVGPFMFLVFATFLLIVLSDRRLRSTYFQDGA